MDKWILRVPMWEGTIEFTYDTVSFILVIVTLLAGLILCFMGYKYLQALCLVVLGCLMGIAGIRLTDGMTQNLVLKMCLFVIFTFLGVCLFYGFSIIVVSVLKILHIKEKCARYGYLFSAFFGAGIVGVVTYLYVYRNILAVSLLSVVLFVSGALWGKKQAAKRKVFHTYDELCELKPLEGEGGTPCSMSAGES